MSKFIIKSVMTNDLEEAVKDTLYYIKELEKENIRLRKEMDDWSEKKEIKKYKKKAEKAYSLMNRGFNPDDSQWDSIHRWENEHKEKYHKKPENYVQKTKANIYAPQIEYTFSDTHLGRLGSVVCVTCYKKAFKKAIANGSDVRTPADNYYSFYFGEV